MTEKGRLEKYTKYFFILLVLFVSFFLLYYLRIVTFPLIIAFFLAYILAPVVDKLEKWRINRTLGISLLIFFVFFFFALFFFLVAPKLIKQISSFISNLPEFLNAILIKIRPYIEKYIGLSPEFEEEVLKKFASEYAMEVVAPTTWLIENIFKSVLNFFLFVLNFIIFIVFTYYILKNYHRIIGYIYEMIPPRHREKTKDIALRINESLAGFIRGQLTVCVILASLYSVGLTIIGIQFAPAIGVIAGISNIIPYMSIIFGLSASLLMAVLEFPGWLNFFAIFIVFAVVQIIDTSLLTPNIIGSKTGLNPMVVIISALIGAKLLGFLGLLLAVPVSAVLKVILNEIIKAYKSSQIYSSENNKA